MYILYMFSFILRLHFVAKQTFAESALQMSNPGSRFGDCTRLTLLLDFLPFLSSSLIVLETGRYYVTE